MRSGIRVLFVLCGFILLPGQASAEQDKIDAARLLDAGKKSIARLVDVAQEEKSLNANDSKAKIFWEAILQADNSLADARTALEKQDDSFFDDLAAARAASQQASIALLMVGEVGEPVKKSMREVSTILSALDDNYSKEAARLKQGGDLTPEERAQLDQLKKQHKELLDRLDQIEKTAAKNNKEMQESIKEMRENSRRIANARYSAVDYCGAMFAARFVTGAVWGWHFWWGPWGYWGPGFVNININIWDTWVDTYAYDWALLQDAIDTVEVIEAVEALEVLDAAAALEAGDDWPEDRDFELNESDLMELTREIEAGGWDDVDSDLGREVMDGMQSNFDHNPFEGGFEMDVFDDIGGFDDFGSDFDF